MHTWEKDQMMRGQLLWLVSCKMIQFRNMNISSDNVLWLMQFCSVTLNLSSLLSFTVCSLTFRHLSCNRIVFNYGSVQMHLKHFALQFRNPPPPQRKIQRLLHEAVKTSHCETHRMLIYGDISYTNIWFLVVFSSLISAFI